MTSRLAPGYARPEDVDDPLRGLGAATTRYRAMAYLVGTGLLVLCLVGMPLQYLAGIPQVDAIVGPIHGFLYIVYLLTALDLARRARFTLGQMGAMIGAGFLPFLAFVIERRVARRLEAWATGAGADGAGAGAGAAGAGGAGAAR
jgi:integral membrane protein